MRMEIDGAAFHIVSVFQSGRTAECCLWGANPLLGDSMRRSKGSNNGG